MLAFDREGGMILERLVVRPEIAAFERGLRDRIDRLGLLEDERIARPRTIVRQADGALVVVSEFVPGSRLAELLEDAAGGHSAPGIDAAVGFLLDVLPALCGLHAGARFAHGTIAPARIVVTPAGQVVLLDAIYGDALARLRYGAHRLWTEFGVAFPSGTGDAAPADVRSDIAQTAIAALMIVLGRPLDASDWPAARAALLAEADEIAQIRGGDGFSGLFRSFLMQALGDGPPRGFPSADDALIAARDLAAALGGMDGCHRALVDWVQQLHGSESGGVLEFGDEVPLSAAPLDEQDTRAADPLALLDDEELLSLVIETVDVPDVDAGAPQGHPGWEDADPADAGAHPGDAELDVDALLDAASPAPLTSLPAVEDMSSAAAADAPLAAREVPPANDECLAGDEPPAVEPVGRAPFAEAELPPHVPEPAPPAAAAHTPAVRTRRAKRVRSARARKDRLRSAATPAGLLAQQADPARTPDPPPAAPDSDATPGDAPVTPERAPAPWQVRPEPDARLVAAPPVAPYLPPLHAVPPGRPPFAGPAAPPGIVAPAPPPVPLYPAAVSGTVVPFPSPLPPPPVAPSIPQPLPFAAPAPTAPPAPLWTPPPAPPPVSAPAPAPLTLKVKEPSPRQKVVRAARPVVDIYAPAPPPQTAPPPRVPWRLAALVVVAIAVAAAAGRAYLPARSATPDEATAALEAAATAAPPFVPPTAPTGHISVQSQPAGARVLLDGKAAGETPVTITNVPTGRHSVTVVGPAGSVTRTVRIDAGSTATVDVPIFSGWIGIFAPFVLEVRSGGRLIGTTEESRLMLPPGRHELVLSNRDLAYRTVQTVDVEPGQVRTITLDPRGTANVNATPWAEVWMDDQKLGDTPLASVKLPIGTRELVFRHPQLGERRTTVTIKGSGTASISVDMNR